MKISVSLAFFLLVGGGVLGTAILGALPAAGAGSSRPSPGQHDVEDSEDPVDCFPAWDAKRGRR